MMSIQVQGRDVALTPAGFLAEFMAWDEDVAKAIAREDGLELNDCHWAAIQFMRRFFEEYELPPSPRVMIREVGHQLTRYGKCRQKDLKSLFPQGGCKQACRIAGLPTFYCHPC